MASYQHYSRYSYFLCVHSIKRKFFFSFIELENQCLRSITVSQNSSSLCLQFQNSSLEDKLMLASRILLLLLPIHGNYEKSGQATLLSSLYMVTRNWPLTSLSEPFRRVPRDKLMLACPKDSQINSINTNHRIKTGTDTGV